MACGLILPPTLVDLLETTILEVENRNEQDELEIKYNEMMGDDYWKNLLSLR